MLTPNGVLNLVEQWFAAKGKRAIDNQMFRGTVSAVRAGQGSAFLCDVIPVGATAPLRDLACCTPGYTPVVGDDVECMWRDNRIAYMLWPVKGVASAPPPSSGPQWVGVYHSANQYVTPGVTPCRGLDDTHTTVVTYLWANQPTYGAHGAWPDHALVFPTTPDDNMKAPATGWYHVEHEFLLGYDGGSSTDLTEVQITFEDRNFSGTYQFLGAKQLWTVPAYSERTFTSGFFGYFSAGDQIEVDYQFQLSAINNGQLPRAANFDTIFIEVVARLTFFG
jgi:hypothetical protein